MNNFEELNLIEQIDKALVRQKYTTPTPIQAQTIPEALAGKDVLGCAQTGTGKTAAFSIPILNSLGDRNRRAQAKMPFALILAPTRELAVQIADNIKSYGHFLHLRTALVYGGVNQFRQVKAMQKGAHIVVATPGRLLDLIDQGHISLKALEMFVLDEADRMMDMGFMPDLTRIVKMLPAERQSLFFSATLPPKIVELANKLLVNPVRIDVTPKESPGVKLIKQQLIAVGKKEKQQKLEDILVEEQVERCIVFTKTKRTANRVAEQLERIGHKATAIHGNKSQNARQKSLDSFKKGQTTVLVATDLASRGIDVEAISHVINYDLPLEPEAYVHRIGRTGRAGAGGIAISFFAPDEKSLLFEIESFIGREIPGDRPQRGRSSGGGRQRSGRGRENGRDRRRERGSTAPREGSSRSRQSGGFKNSSSRSFEKNSGGKDNRGRDSRFEQNRNGDQKFGNRRSDDRKHGESARSDRPEFDRDQNQSDTPRTSSGSGEKRRFENNGSRSQNDSRSGSGRSDSGRGDSRRSDSRGDSRRSDSRRGDSNRGGSRPHRSSNPSAVKPKRRFESDKVEPAKKVSVDEKLDRLIAEEREALKPVKKRRQRKGKNARQRERLSQTE